MNENDSISVRAAQIRSEIWRTIKAVPREAIAYVGALSAIGIAFDLWGSSASQSGVGIADLIATYLLLLAMLRARNLMPVDQEKKFGSYFGLGILSGLATLVGFVLLIVPGVILLVRWAPAYGYLFGQNRDVSDALSESWTKTKPHFGAILLAYLLGFAGYLVAMVVSVIPEFSIVFPFAVVSVVSNLLLYAASLYISALGIAVYLLLEGEGSQFEEVFA